MSVADRLAIVLHGPPGVGKSTVADEILTRSPGAQRISLDDGWSPGEFRFMGGPGRYADLAASPASILVLELGWGEPVGDMSRPGATRGADEWASVLRSADRRVMPFLLWADFDEVVRRLTDRNRERGRSVWDTVRELGMYALYEHKHPLALYPASSGLQETLIITTGLTVGAVAEQILQRAKTPSQ